jgi:signal transduction histidine kinase
MSWTPTGFTAVVLGSAVVATVVGVAALRERPDPLAWPLALLMFMVAAWAVPHAISFGFTSVDDVMFWHKVRYPGTVATPVLYLVLAVKYAGHERWLTGRVYVLLAVVPVVTVVAVASDPVHGLFWQDHAVEHAHGAVVFTPTVGPWYWVNLAYLYLVTLVALGVFGSVVVRSGPVYRKQALLMFVAGLVPLIVNGLINLGGLFEPTVDFTTTALALTGFLFAVALYRLDLMELRPVARERLVEELEDGVVVLDHEGRIRDFNPTAERVLGDIEIEQDAAEVLPKDTSADGSEFAVDTPDGERLFRFRSSSVTDRRGDMVGRIVYLNDVTDLVEREQRISVLNRVLRHNIRNELSVVSANLGLIVQEHPEVDDSLDPIRDSTERIADFAEKGRHVEQTIKQADATVNVAVREAIESATMDLRERYPEATIECTDSFDGMKVCVTDGELFGIVLTEMIENAIVHNDREKKVVKVHVGGSDSEVWISVADNGPGIPVDEVESLSVTRETPLDHTSGLGLWLTKWFASLSGGELHFEDNDPRGAIVILSLEPAG